MTTEKLDRFLTLDEILANIRQAHADELKAVNDALLASNIELELTRRSLEVTTRDAAKWARIATQLITQFGTVEKVFSEAKVLAQRIADDQAMAEAPPPKSLSEPHTEVPRTHFVEEVQ